MLKSITCVSDKVYCSKDEMVLTDKSLEDDSYRRPREKHVYHSR
jgi:hypothetical protein